MLMGRLPHETLDVKVASTVVVSRREELARLAHPNTSLQSYAMLFEQESRSTSKQAFYARWRFQEQSRDLYCRDLYCYVCLVRTSSQRRSSGGWNAGGFRKIVCESARRVPNHGAVVVVWAGCDEARVATRTGTDEGGRDWRNRNRHAVSSGAG